MLRHPARVAAVRGERRVHTENPIGLVTVELTLIVI